MQGPQLPPHLQRKRDEERESETTNDTPTSDASIGPQRPTIGPSVGPQLPAHLRKASPDEDSGSNDAPAIGPSRPTVGSQRPQVGPQRPPSPNASMSPIRPPQGPQRPVVGPTMPPAPLNQRPCHPANTPPPADPDSDDDFGPLPPGASKDDDDDDDSSDDGFGPQLPTGDSAAEEAAALARLSSHASASSTVDKNKPVRDAWMLAPPTSSDISSRMDPTKLKNRKFQTGKGARAPHSGGTGSSGPGSLWTETPEQKAARLRDEMLGIKRPAQIETESAGEPGDAAKRRKKAAEEEETARRVAEYTEKYRGQALVKEHQEGRKGRKDVEESDDPSKRGFDWEKDIKRGVRIGEKQKADMLKRAGGMGDRFAKGKYL